MPPLKLFNNRDLDLLVSKALSFHHLNLGEVMSILKDINTTEPSTWALSFTGSATKLKERAEKVLEEKSGSKESGAIAQVRGAMEDLLRCCQMFLIAGRLKHRILKGNAVKARAAFKRACEIMSPPATVVDLHVGTGGGMYGYLLLPEKPIPSAPCLLFIGGIDQCAEEVFMGYGRDCLRLGYPVCVCDDGFCKQGAIYGSKNVSFDFYDENDPLYGLVTYILKQPKISGCVLIGLGTSGFLALRASIFEHRLSGCAANPPVMNLQQFTKRRNTFEMNVASGESIKGTSNSQAAPGQSDVALYDVLPGIDNITAKLHAEADDVTKVDMVDSVVNQAENLIEDLIRTARETMDKEGKISQKKLKEIYDMSEKLKRESEELEYDLTAPTTGLEKKDSDSKSKASMELVLEKTGSKTLSDFKAQYSKFSMTTEMVHNMVNVPVFLVANDYERDWVEMVENNARCHITSRVFEVDRDDVFESEQTDNPFLFVQALSSWVSENCMGGGAGGAKVKHVPQTPREPPPTDKLAKRPSSKEKRREGGSRSSSRNGPLPEKRAQS